MIPIKLYLVLSGVLFVIGTSGVLVRKNVLVMLMSVEIMLNAVNLAFVSFARYMMLPKGQVYVFFSITVAAAEVIVGLAIIISIFHKKESMDVDDMNVLKG
ncbi:MAG: NADH-quinone oxidoreductase subunit NuoK [Candidatus Omnitrophica bacterium]|nr:NADH-quinone oxidoreductase subunit NuoK [Candidatus Omnitrophota bacterium]